MTEWEGSPSSDDHDTDVASACAAQSNQIKYIPINYFAYFDNANLESDEFTDQTVHHLPQPPQLPQVHVPAFRFSLIINLCRSLVYFLFNNFILYYVSRCLARDPKWWRLVCLLSVIWCHMLSSPLCWHLKHKTQCYNSVWLPAISWR